MLHPYQILLPLCSLLLVRVDLTDLMPMKMAVEVTQVIDGDTLEVKKGKYHWRIRLSRLDAPEKAQNFYLDGSAGAFAKKCLEQQLSTDKKIMLQIEGYDIYRRVLGDVDELNFKSISSGCSGLYPHTQFASRKEKALYLRARFMAKKMRRGIWGTSGYRQPKLWRKSSKRSAHRPSHR